jgi:predicted AlkP superfamily pyrophosphatase or phosphodiesterase
MEKIMRIFFKKQGTFDVLGAILLAGSLFFGLTPPIVSQVSGVKHVVIIGCDGLSPDGVQKAKTPNIDGLMQRGAYTMRARGVMPTSSSPNWASMIMGAGPEQHGITSNAWRPDKFEMAPTAVGAGGIFPTIFGVLREQQPSAVIACFHDWGGFGVLFEREALDVIEDTDGPVKTTERAVAYFKAKQPDLTFIHLDHIDHAGHKYGHGTSEYYKSVEEADRLIGETIKGLKAAGMLEQTILIVTSDHGGVGKGHGGATMAEIEIPWIIAGPGVTPAKELTSFVDTYDTAATVAHIFGLTAPDCWIAKSVLEAFGAP